MDFSKKGTTGREKQIRSASRKLGTKFRIFLFQIFLICVIASAILLVSSGIGAFKGIIDSAPKVDPKNIKPSGFSTTIYDSKGKEIRKLVGSDANRTYVKLDKIPKVVQNAFISIEDERFWDHNGIDVKGIFRAFYQGIIRRDFGQGASTLTQQLIKNQIFEGGNEENQIDRFSRKLQEQYLAIQLEHELSKEEILEYYLNTINLGQNTLGVQAASKRYFDKEVSKLTLSEAAVIAGITKNPVGYNPITYPEENAKRRSIILKYMLEQNYITENQYKKALKDNVYERIQDINNEKYSTANVNSYFVDELINQVITDLQKKKGYSQTEAANALYRGGLSIYTTQDTGLQNICDKVINNAANFPSNSKWSITYRLSVLKKNGKTVNYSEGHVKNYFLQQNPRFSMLFSDKKAARRCAEEFKHSVVKKGDTVTGESISYSLEPQVSFVLMEQKSGKVKALVGGRGKKEANLTLNRASQTTRQPGSTFKILSTYLPALDTSGKTLASVQDDAPYTYPGSTKPVKNWDGRYRGLTTLREAIYRSINIVTLKTLEDVTPQTSFSYLKKLGFTTLVENRVDKKTGRTYSDINLPLALGGLTDGITNLELTAAFASIANQGEYNKPVFYTKIVDHSGNVILENKPKKQQVIKNTTAWLLTDAMQDVVRKGTGTPARFRNTSMPLAGKTGTTNNDNDLWFVGYTPYYTAGIWGGYDNNGDQQDTLYHKNIWRMIMEEVHKGLEIKAFERPNTIVTAKICTKCGKLAIDGVCDKAEGGSAAAVEYFDRSLVPTEKCDCHVKIRICNISGKPAGKYCPEDSVAEKVYLVKKNSSDATADDPYLLPVNFKESKCDVHTSLLDSNKTDKDDVTKESEKPPAPEGKNIPPVLDNPKKNRPDQPET